MASGSVCGDITLLKPSCIFFGIGEWLSLPEEASWEFGSSDSRQPMSVGGLEYEYMSLPRCSRFVLKGSSLSG